MTRRPRLETLWLLIGVMAVTLALSTEAPGLAQCPTREVTRSACPRQHHFVDGVCRKRTWLGYVSYCRLERCSVCTASETLDSTRGVCISRRPFGRAACPSGRTFRDGKCFRRNGLGYQSFCLIERCNVCTAGETLDRVNGLCC